MARRLMKTLGRICAVLLVTFPSLAHAAAAPLIAIAAQWAFSAGVITSIWVATAISVGASIFGLSYQRRKAKKAAAAARRAFVDSLEDRFVTTLRADPPQRIVYGTAITGGDIVAILTSDKEGIESDGDTYTLPDGYKHIVLALAAHEVQSINEVYIDGVPVGTLDAGGWATGGEFGDAKTYTTQTILAPGASKTYSSTPTIISSGYYVGGNVSLDEPATWVPVTPTVNGTQVTNPSAYEIYVTASFVGANSRVRVEKYLGTSAQTASSYLMTVCPDEWTSTDRLRGIAYIIVTLDLEEQRFQGGPPQIAASISGRKVYDPRTGLTAYSGNPALVCRDYIVSEWGFDADEADIDDASVIAAANACDVSIQLLVGILNVAGPKYRCDGVVTSEDDPASVLEEMASSMAGFVTHSGGRWVVNSGTYTAPVLALDDDDLAGPIEILQTGAAYEDLMNGVRGQMIETGRLSASDIDPYQNTTFVAADGLELWEDMSFPFTGNRYRARCLARIRVEQARDSMLVRYPAKLVAWPVQIGDRVTVTSAEYGWSAKVFRVTDWAFETGAPVMLTLQEDAAAIYDLADAATTDQAQNTGLPNPWVVPAVTGVSATSGSTTAILQSDGTILNRVLVAWSRVASAYVTQGGKIVVQWARVGTTITTWNRVEVTGDSTSTYLNGVSAGTQLTISVQAVNSFGATGPATVIAHTVAGKSTAPATPTGLSGVVGQGIITWTWNYPPEADWAETVARTGGTDWATASAFWVGRATTVLQRVTSAATYTLRIKNRNTSGVESASAASASVVVSASDLVQSEPGDPGLGVAVVRLYQWASAQPSNPNSTGRSTYTWATGAHAADGSFPVGNGWTVGSVPTNPGTAGVGLWVCEKSITAPAGTTSSTVIWDGGYSVYKLSVNGATGTPGEDGVDGLKAVTVEVFKWANSVPSAPTGTSTYTWATKSFSAPSTWALTTTGGTAGQTLYAARVTISDAAAALTTTIDWTTAGILAVGYRGLDGATGATGDTGDTGPQGISAKRAYVLTTLTSLGSGTVTTTGPTSLPPDGSFGANGWTATPSTPAVGQTLYQSDGLYNPVTNQINWETPYISALKVGNLSAIAVNTGALTVDNTLTVGTTGSVRGGATGYAATNGWFLGYDNGQYKVRIGDPAGARIQWTGSAVEIYNASNQLALTSGSINWSNITYSGTPPSTIANSAVTISASGLLSGAGGGQVTITGLGYTGALDATKNTIYRQTTAPATNVVDGDIWIDTDAVPVALYVRSGGAWQASATNTTNTNQLTDGAGLGTTALWSGVTGTGKPADNATRNVIYRQTTAPTSPTTGDIWHNTSTATVSGMLPNTLARWSGSAWELIGIGPITATNVSTFIPSAAIGLAQINTATITNLAALNASTGTLSVTGTLTLGTTGKILTSGKTTYNSSTAGVFLGYDSNSQYTFGIGNSTDYIRWDGTALTVGGDIIATGNIQASAVTTTKIAAGAVTAAVGATGANPSSPASVTTETTVVTTGSVTPGSTPFYIHPYVKVFISAGTSGTCSIRVKHGGTIVGGPYTTSYGSGGATIEHAVPIYISAAATSGAVTLTIQNTSTSSTTASGTVFAVAMKR
jgi:hypothetical protein